MREPKNLEDFNQFTEDGKAEWIESELKGNRKPAGFVACNAIDVFIYFERNNAGKIKVVKAEKLTDIRKRYAREMLARRALQNMN